MQTRILFLVAAILFSACIENLITLRNPKYAIGTIDNYRPGGSTLPSSVEFTFYAGVNKQSDGYMDVDHRWNVISNCGHCIGQEFMVQYD